MVALSPLRRHARLLSRHQLSRRLSNLGCRGLRLGIHHAQHQPRTLLLQRRRWWRWRNRRLCRRRQGRLQLVLPLHQCVEVQLGEAQLLLLLCQVALHSGRVGGGG